MSSKTLNLIKDLIKSLLCRIVVVPYLRRKSSSISNISELVNLAYTFHENLPLPARVRAHFSIKPMQVKEEITSLLLILSKLKPKTLLEIGTANGDTLFLFTKVAAPDAIIVSIDLPGGPFGGGYPKWRIPLYKPFAKGRQKIFLIRGDSHDPETLKQVKEILGDRRLDFLFIDGDHTYEGVKRDFEMYSPLVRKGGIVAFHDIVPHPPETGCEVSKFWNEVKNNYRYLEIVKDRKQKWAGIGVLYV